MKKDVKEKLLRNSLSLSRYGISGIAWNQTNAQVALNMVKQDEIGVLGGDVYKLNSHLEVLPDNWYCCPSHSETREEFYTRSKQEACEYIKNYPVDKGENIIFSIVFTEEFTC